MFEEAPATLLQLVPTSDYFRRKGDEAYAFVDATPFVQLGLGFRADEHGTLPDDDEEAATRRQAVAGQSRSLVGALRLVRGASPSAAPRRARESFLQRDLYGVRLEPRQSARVDATFEWASSGTLGGDFDFRRLLVNARGDRVVSPRLHLRLIC